MYRMKVKRLISLILLLTLGLAPFTSAQAGDKHNPPEFPSPLCDSLQVPSGNKAGFRLYAVGVQIYRWNGASWTFVEPVATLYADAAYHEKVGIHYVGPTWESNDGGKVIATRLTACTPEAAAIPWLLLQTVSTGGPGILSSVTYIQRVNTRGGIAPTAPGSSTGALAQVPYAAEYYFYRAKN
jgi:hypothetical protein